MVDRRSHSITFRPIYVRVCDTLLGRYSGLAYQLEFPFLNVCLHFISLLLTPSEKQTSLGIQRFIA